jgi:hypothetical protein
MKVCGRCKIEKEFTEFSKDKRNKDGFQWKCRSCDKQHRDKNKERTKEHHKRNKERIYEYFKKWQKTKYETDNLYKLKVCLRSRTYQAFKRKGYSKNTKTQEMLGVDWEVCKAHIERQFTKGMSWDNYGEWHIDHIIPLASADTEQRTKELCHYTNLQPLWSEDNLNKSDKINGQQTKIRI